MVALFRQQKEMPAMNIAEPKTPPRCSSDANAEAAPAAKTELGFTLQTLIVMAVFVLAAVGVSLGLLAVTSASSDDFEEAGQTGVEARCAPNEIKDPELEARGVAGVNQTYRSIVSDTIGCNPVCGTWEYYNPGRAAEGIGGPDGNGGVYSTDGGCFAPCYWSYWNGNSRPEAQNGVIENNTSLQYSDDNSPPAIKQIRLGVNYWRDDPRTTSIHWMSDLQPHFRSNNLDGKPYIVARNGEGNAIVSGKLPLTPALLQYVPTVFKPNWRSRGPDPGGTARNGGSWEDENWEVRADPYNKVCTIVNTTLDDQVVCSSEEDSCAP